jgi:hypothetical protein
MVQMACSAACTPQVTLRGPHTAARDPCWERLHWYMCLQTAQGLTHGSVGHAGERHQGDEGEGGLHGAEIGADAEQQVCECRVCTSAGDAMPLRAFRLSIGQR